MSFKEERGIIKGCGLKRKKQGTSLLGDVFYEEVPEALKGSLEVSIK